MPNQAGIDDHNGERAEKLVTGYRAINRKAAFPELFDFVEQARAMGRILHILDIGSGAGQNAQEMAACGHTIVGVDPSDLRHIAVRDNAHPSIDYRDDLLPELKTIKDDETFDMVLLNAVWQYIDPVERVPSLLRIAGLLKKNGRLFLRYPTPPSRPYQYEITTEMFQSDITMANALLPQMHQFSFLGDVKIAPDPQGRSSHDGRELNFQRYVIGIG